MRFCLFVLLPLIPHLSASAQDAPKLVVPAEVKAAPGKLVTIKAETVGKKVVWRVPPTLEFRECCDKGIVLVASLPGRYSLLAIAASGDEPLVAECVLVVEGTPPEPPLPPVPPKPPVDPLETELRKIFRDDTAPDKQATILKLAALYKVAANSCQDLQIDTAGRLNQVIRDASTTLVGSGLLSVRRRVGEELAKVLPTDPDAKLTPETRDRATKLFLRLNQICEGIH
jgi:hypothetical protein